MGGAVRSGNIERLNKKYGTNILYYLMDSYEIEEPEGLILCTKDDIMYAEYH